MFTNQQLTIYTSNEHSSEHFTNKYFSKCSDFNHKTMSDFIFRTKSIFFSLTYLSKIWYNNIFQKHISYGMSQVWGKTNSNRRHNHFLGLSLNLWKILDGKKTTSCCCCFIFAISVYNKFTVVLCVCLSCPLRLISAICWLVATAFVSVGYFA